jgi:hypothetical protein
LTLTAAIVYRFQFVVRPMIPMAWAAVRFNYFEFREPRRSWHG